MATDSVGEVLRSGVGIRVEFEGDNPEDAVLEGTFVGVGTDLHDGQPILYVDEGKPTIQSVELRNVRKIEPGRDRLQVEAIRHSEGKEESHEMS